MGFVVFFVSLQFKTGQVMYSQFIMLEAGLIEQ